MSDGLIVILVFAAGLIGFATNRIRHDLVALLMLAACVLLGLVPASEAFAGDEDGDAVVEALPLRPNPVTQDEMDAGSVELF